MDKFGRLNKNADTSDFILLNSKIKKLSLRLNSLQDWALRTVPEIAEKADFLEKQLGFQPDTNINKKSKIEELDDLRKYILTYIPKIGEQVQFIENFVGVPPDPNKDENEKKTDFDLNTNINKNSKIEELDELRKYVFKYIPEIGERIAYIEKFVGAPSEDPNEDKKKKQK